ncbi:MAG: type III pantothenate kinase, partial [Chitinophagia bacterium]|nr:type III pantothenate kinase [Chitinophagia bacterium]
MSIKLCIDWGNTNIKAAVFTGNNLSQRIEISADHTVNELLALKEASKAERAILCSVADHPAELTDLLKDNLKSLIVLNGHTPVPINNAYSSPDTLGPDRLALVCAAYVLHPGLNNLVISAGTCVTYNMIQKNRTFRGGAIAPGLRMRLRAIHEFTGKLPETELDGDLMLL